MPPQPSCHFAATATACTLVLRVAEDKKMPDTQSGRDYPDYIAFRTADGGRLTTVVAVLEPDDGSLFPWATRYHAQAPTSNDE